MVCRGISPLAIIRGSGGLGKSWNVTETLNEEGFLLDRDYVTISGHSTPLELYNLLYAHKDKKVILLDDVSGLLENNTSVSLLKAASWGIKKRLVSYNTTSEKLTVPELFEMKAGLIVIVNEEPRKDKSFKALMTRGLVCEVEFTHTEVLSILKEVAVKSYPHLPLDKRLEVYKFIEDNVHIASQINIRTLIKSFQAYQYGEDWKEIILNLLKPNADLKLVKELIDKHHRVKDAVKEWIEQTGESKRKFQYLKVKLGIEKRCKGAKV